MVFVDLARSRNMRKTATNLGLTEATVSYRLQQLEIIIGHDLFSRESKKLEITQFGKEFYPDAIQIVSILNRHLANHKLSTVSNVIKVSSGEIAAIYMLPELIKSFKEKNSDITVGIKNGSSREIIQDLVDANSDVCLTVNIDFPEFHSIISKMSVTELTNIDLIFIAPKYSKFLDRKIVAPKDLVDMPYISRDATSGVQCQIERILAMAGMSENDLNIVLKLKNSASVISAVSEGLGTSIVSMVQAEKDIKNGSIGWLPLDTDVKTSLYLVDRWNGVNDTVNKLVAFTKSYMNNYTDKKK